MDSKKSILFKYLEKPAPGKEYQMLAEFEADSKSQAIANLYLSAQYSTPSGLYDEAYIN